MRFADPFNATVFDLLDRFNPEPSEIPSAVGRSRMYSCTWRIPQDGKNGIVIFGEMKK